MRQDRTKDGMRSSALWGKRSGGDSRSSALWGKGGGRGTSILLALVIALLTPLAATAAPSPAKKGKKPAPVTKPVTPAPAPAPTETHEHGKNNGKAHIDPKLNERAKNHPNDLFRVIVEVNANGDIKAVAAEFARNRGQMQKYIRAITGVAGLVTGEQLLALAEHPDVLGITPDLPVAPAGFEPTELWPRAIRADMRYSRDAVTCALDDLTGLQLDPLCTPIAAFDAPKAPTIAIVDSGVEPGRVADFGGRLVKSVNVTASASETDDDYGHGTHVAALAAGAAVALPGVAPTADIVSVRVMDDQGVAYTSDVIAAADWILAHKDQHNIRVANFSLRSGNANSFRFDPLDHAVERLWFAGVTVVASSGNFGTGGRMEMNYAPGNDPFVITVGAADVMGTEDLADDTVAPWSAYGYTADGFAKPEVVAPGRYMVAAVPAGSTLATTRTANVVAPGYLRLSGTSMAAGVVSGAVAQLLALHPEWGPDQVKGALMVAATPTAAADDLADGVGGIDLVAAAAVVDPPNPNLALRQFVVADPNAKGGYAFAEASWANTAAADASWANASWANASWANASWANASWANASWANASWANASYASASWANAAEADSALADASWANASWANASWANASWANAADAE
jgi:serine protease AprX